MEAPSPSAATPQQRRDKYAAQVLVNPLQAIHVRQPDGTAAVRAFVGPNRPQMFALVIDISGSTSFPSNVPGRSVVDLECAVACSIIACLPPGTVVTIILFDNRMYHVQKPIAIPLDIELAPQELINGISYLAIIDDESLTDDNKIQKITEDGRFEQLERELDSDPKTILADIAAQLHKDVRVSIMYKVMCAANAKDGGNTSGYSALGNSQDFFTITQQAHIVFLGDGLFTDKQEDCRWSALTMFTFHFIVFQAKQQLSLHGFRPSRSCATSGLDRLLQMANKLAPGNVHVPVDLEGIAAAITAILSPCRKAINLEDLCLYWSDGDDVATATAATVKMPTQAQENVPFTIEVVPLEDAEASKNMFITYPRGGTLMQVEVAYSDEAKPTYYTSDIEAVCTELSRVQVRDKTEAAEPSSEDVATTTQQAKKWFTLCAKIRAEYKLDQFEHYKKVRGPAVHEPISVQLQANRQMNVELSAKWAQGGKTAQEALEKVMASLIDQRLVRQWDNYNAAIQNVAMSDDVPEMPGDVHRLHTEILDALQKAYVLISAKVALGEPRSKEDANTLWLYTQRVTEKWGGFIQNAQYEPCRDLHQEVIKEQVIIDASKPPNLPEIGARITASASALNIPHFGECILKGHTAKEVLSNLLSELEGQRAEIDALLLNFKPKPNAAQYKRRKIVHNAATSVEEPSIEKGSIEHYQVLRDILDGRTSVCGVSMPLSPVDVEVPIPPEHAAQAHVRWGVLRSSPASALPQKPSITLDEHKNNVEKIATARLNEPRRIVFPAGDNNYYILDARDCRSVSILTDILTGVIPGYEVLRSSDKSKLGLDFDGIGIWSTSQEAVLMLIKGRNAKEFNMVANTNYYPISGSDYQYVELSRI